ncbi:hypothetical protein [Leptotrichia wadei]|nr:hypothetical protein [Leptotrichia wadei]
MKDIIALIISMIIYHFSGKIKKIVMYSLPFAMLYLLIKSILYVTF